MAPLPVWAGLQVLAAALAAAPGALPPAGGDSARFVVLGHIRGDRHGLNPRLGELLERARALRPDFVVLTGDIIWGDIQRPLTDPAVVEREWEEVDSAVATLGVPVYRVPGNHDIPDLPARDVWLRRYGSLPRAVVAGPVRLLLLSSTWMPADGDSGHTLFVRGVDLDSAQVAWLARELRSPAPVQHTFAFMHHLLWWQPDDGRWWTEVHPLLVAGGVKAVFTGDYGPLKFSALERDGVRYYQSSIETPVSVDLLRARLSSRILSAQFDNFLEVRVAGPEVEVTVHTVAELSSGEFTPERHRAINEPLPSPPLAHRVWTAVGTPRRLAALGGAILGLLLIGFAVGRATARRGRSF